MNRKSGLAPYKKTALAFGGLFSAFECFFVVFLFAYLRMLVPPYAVALIAGITMAASVALIPLLYALINRIRSFVLGRYHGPLIVATLIGAFMFCLFFSTSPTASMAYKVSISVLSLFFLCLAVQTFTYCSFSITERVVDHSERFEPLLQNAVSVCVVGAVIVMMFFYFDFTATAIGKMAYIVGCLMLTAGCAVYFSTYTVIPKMLNVRPRPLRIKAAFVRFFRMKKAAALAYAGRYLSMTGMLVICLAAVIVVDTLWGLSASGMCAAFAAAAVAGAALRFTFFRGPAEPSHYRIFSIVGATAVIVGVCAAVGLPLFVEFTEVAAYATLCACACVCGGGYALLSIAYTGYMEHTYSLSGSTRGTHKCIKGMLTTAAVATATVILSIMDATAAAFSGTLVNAIVIAATVGLFSIAGAVLSVKGEQLGNVQKD